MAASLILSTRSARFIGLRLMACDQIALADNETSLRPAEQFVAGKRHNVRGGHGLTDCRLRLQPVLREVH